MFSSEPEPVEFACDAPPFPIVRACAKLGFRAPQDVRWCHASHSAILAPEPKARTGLSAWKALLGMGERKPAGCVCGDLLPALERYTFLLKSGSQVHYYLAQCSRCRTMHWREG